MSSDEDAPSTPGNEEEAPPTPSSIESGSSPPNSAEKVTQTPRTLPRSEVHFAFGPQKWYWARCGTSWRFVRSGQSDWSAINIQDPYWVAFKHTTGFLVGGEDEDGDPQIWHSWNDGYMVRAGDVDEFVKSRDAYQKLHDWLDSKQLKDTSLSIGPNGSYFARFGSSWISHALPKDLMSKLESNKDRCTPIHVALGIHGSWVVLWSDRELSWNLRNSYPSLSFDNVFPGIYQATGKKVNDQVVFVALSPYDEDKYFAVGECGSIAYNTTLPSKEESKLLHQMTDNYMRMRAKRDGTTFKYPCTIGGQPRQVSISPDTYEDRAADTLLSTWKDRRNLLLRRDNIALIGAGAVAVGVTSKMAGATPLRATGLAVAAGFGGTIAMLYGIRDGLRHSH